MKVEFDITCGKLSIEGTGPDLIAVLQAARDIAPSVAEIRLITGPSSNRDNGEIDHAEDENLENGKRSPSRQGIPTLREFARSISPANIAERIVACAAYAARYESRDSFSPKEIADWFTICGFQRPAQMPVALFSAKSRYGYVENPSHGRWKLTTAGDNLVTRKLEGPIGAA
jgi:hypothetical protein